MICKLTTLYTNVILLVFIRPSHSLLPSNNNLQQPHVNGEGGVETGPTTSGHKPSEMTTDEVVPGDEWQTWFPFTSHGDDTDFSYENPPDTGPNRKSCRNLYKTEMYSDRLKQAGIDLTEEIQVCGLKLEEEASERKNKRQIRFSKNMDTSTNNANYNDHPWSVRLKICYTIRIQFRTAGGEVREFIKKQWTKGTGSVIHKHFILTAAHVLPEGHISTLQTLLGQRDRRTIRQLTDMIREDVPKLKERIDILSVELGNSYLITMFLGPISINKDVDKVIKTKKSTRIMIIDNKNKIYTQICPSFGHCSTSKEAGLKDICDIGLIFLEGPKKLAFHGSNIRPVCLPGYNGEEHEYQTCAPHVGDQFVLAGYGLTQDYLEFQDRKWNELISNPVGLNQANFTIYKSRFSRGKEPFAILDGKANPNQMFGDAKVIGPGKGDSGAAWTFQRYNTHGKEVAMQLGLHSITLNYRVRGYKSTGAGDEISGANLLFYSKWIVDAMIKLWKQNF